MISRVALGRPTAAPDAAPASPEPPALAAPLPLPPLLAAPAHEPGRVAGGVESPPLSSSTLAELYLGQGFVDKAIEVYREITTHDADPARVRESEKRLKELMSPTSR